MKKILNDKELLDYLSSKDSYAYADLCEAYSRCANASLRNEIEKRVKSETMQEKLKEFKLAKERSTSGIKGVIAELTDENTLMNVAGATRRTRSDDGDVPEL